MCEFKVFLRGELVYEDAVYAEANEGTIRLKNILGETRAFRNCFIAAVDVTSERLELAPVEPENK